MILNKINLFNIIDVDFKVGWARHRWNENLFKNTFPLIAKYFLNKNGVIILPYLSCVEESLTQNQEFLDPYFFVHFLSDPNENPLYLATEKVEKELLMCPDAVTNKTQIIPLNQFSTTPFCVLRLRDLDF